MPQDWLKIQNKKDDKDTGEIFLYGIITDEKWFDEDVTPSWFKDQIAKLKDFKNINLYINSPGGGVFAGMTIYNIINRLTSKVTAYIDGLAASIASVIPMAADIIVMPKNAMMMIHNPWSAVAGDAAFFRKEADMLDRVKTAIVSTYKEKTNKKEDEISALMDAETWMTGEEAKKGGFTDVLEEKKDIKACLNGGKFIINNLEVDIDKFKSFPKEHFNALPDNAERTRLIIARQKILQFRNRQSNN
jgi:ATP-dependent Clp protease protease subunit